RFIKGINLYQGGHWAKAKESLESLVKENMPDKAKAVVYTFLGDVVTRLNPDDLGAALTYYDRAKGLDADNPIARFGIGEVRYISSKQTVCAPGSVNRRGLEDAIEDYSSAGDPRIIATVQSPYAKAVIKTKVAF